MSTLKVKTGSDKGTSEWIMKEHGSWEDANYAEDHVCAILQRESSKSVMILTKEEAETLLKSINYQLSAGWDGWEDYKEEMAVMSSWRGYKRRLRKALS